MGGILFQEAPGYSLGAGGDPGGGACADGEERREEEDSVFADGGEEDDERGVGGERGGRGETVLHGTEIGDRASGGRAGGGQEEGSVAGR